MAFGTVHLPTGIRQEKYSTYCIHIVYVFRSIFTCFYKVVFGIIVNLHNTQYDGIDNFHRN